MKSLFYKHTDLHDSDVGKDSSIAAILTILAFEISDPRFSRKGMKLRMPCIIKNRAVWHTFPNLQSTFGTLLLFNY